MSTLRRTFGLFLAGFATACGDSGKFKELVGTYDITTTLATYEYTIPGADCSTGLSNCRRTDPANGATFTGTLTISGNGDAELGVASFSATGTGQGNWCTDLTVSGCAGLGAISLTFPGVYTQASDFLVSTRLDEGTSGGSVVALSSSRLEGNKLTGDIIWTQRYQSGIPSAYTGTFVATKR